MSVKKIAQTGHATGPGQIRVYSSRAGDTKAVAGNLVMIIFVAPEQYMDARINTVTQKGGTNENM